MTAAQTWLDIMPAIPLARGVPVVDLTSADEDERFTVTGSRRKGIEPWPLDTGWQRYEAELRVDLDDPQGFGYALREWARAEPWVVANNPHLPGHRLTPEWQAAKERKGLFCGIANQHLAGETTDADRVALAGALREVTP